MINFVDEKLLANVYKLAVDDPGVELVVKYFMTAKKYLSEHILNDRISTGALLV